ncbi:MAG: NYN domain-containing protein [Paraprevotella sp.]|nr:NYN domain-containing protein [Paraprevotella sp.]
MTNKLVKSIGLFIDGGYYAKVDEQLYETSGMHLDINKLIHYIRSTVADLCNTEKSYSQVIESHYFRGRFRASEANVKKLLFAERRFEDSLIENDVIFHYKHLREIDGNIIEKGIDVWYALEAYELATIRQFNYVVLITGDADHEMLIKKLKALHINVILLTGDFGEKSATSRLLRDEATLHIDLGEKFQQQPEMVEKLCRK